MANHTIDKFTYGGETYILQDNTSGYTSNTGTISKIQTSAGAHSTVSVTAGTATFNVPTKTSHLTNDSGYITSAPEAHNLTFTPVDTTWDVSNVGNGLDSLNNSITTIGEITDLTAPSTIDIVSAINSINILNHSNTLSSGDNLNNFISPGIYLGEANIVNSLSNTPPSLAYSNGNVTQYPNFKLIVSELGTGMIRQQIISGDFANTAHTGKDWTRYYDSANQTWTNWYSYLIAQESDNDYRYVAPTRNSKIYDFGLNGMRIRRDQSHKYGYTLMNEDFTVGSSATTGAGGGYHIRTANDPIAFYGGGLTSDGDSYAQLYSQNSSDSINQLKLTKKEDGSNVVSVTSPTAWRSAIGAAPALSRVTIANGATKSLTSGSNGNVTNYTFSQGLWMISVRASFASSSVGRRAVFLSTSSTGGAVSPNVNTNQQATNGATTVLGWMALVDLSASTKYYINAYQNSNASNTVTLYAYAVKLD